MNASQKNIRRRLFRNGIILCLLVLGAVGIYSLPIRAPELPDTIPLELKPRFEAAHAYIWPEILAGWTGPAIGILAICLILDSGLGRRIEERYRMDRVRRWPMRVLFLIGVYGFIAVVEAGPAARSFYHARAYGLTDLSYGESVGLSLRGMPFALAVFLLKYLLIFCCMAVFRARWWMAAAVLALLVFHVIPERVSRTVPVDPITSLTPLPDGPARDAMERVSRLAGEEMTYLVEDRSRRSRTANMYMTGRVGREYVVVTDTLIECLHPDELAAVLAHEYGHKVTRRITVTLNWVLTVATLLAIFYMVHRYHGGRPIAESCRLQALIHVLLAAQVVGLIAHPLNCAIYRHQERSSDAYALALTGNPHAFRAALLTVSAANLEPWDVPAWVYYSAASHPVLKDRVREVETFGIRSGKGSDSGQAGP